MTTAPHPTDPAILVFSAIEGFGRLIGASLALRVCAFENHRPSLIGLLLSRFRRTGRFHLTKYFSGGPGDAPSHGFLFFLVIVRSIGVHGIAKRRQVAVALSPLSLLSFLVHQDFHVPVFGILGAETENKQKKERPFVSRFNRREAMWYANGVISAGADPASANGSRNLRSLPSSSTYFRTGTRPARRSRCQPRLEHSVKRKKERRRILINWRPDPAHSRFVAAPVRHVLHRDRRGASQAIISGVFFSADAAFDPAGLLLPRCTSKHNHQPRPMGRS